MHSMQLWCHVGCSKRRSSILRLSSASASLHQLSSLLLLDFSFDFCYIMVVFSVRHFHDGNCLNNEKKNYFNTKQPLTPNSSKPDFLQLLTHQTECLQNLLVHWWWRLGRNVCQIFRAIKSSSWFLAPLLREMLSSYKLGRNKCDCSSKIVCMLSVALSSVTVKPGQSEAFCEKKHKHPGIKSQFSKVSYFHHAYSTVQYFPITYINFFFLSLK